MVMFKVGTLVLLGFSSYAWATQNNIIRSAAQPIHTVRGSYVTLNRPEKFSISLPQHSPETAPDRAARVWFFTKEPLPPGLIIPSLSPAAASLTM